MKKSFSFDKPPRMPAGAQPSAMAERSASSLSQSMLGLAQYEEKITAASEALQAVQRSRDQLESLRQELDRARQTDDMDAMERIAERLTAMDRMNEGILTQHSQVLTLLPPREPPPSRTSASSRMAEMNQQEQELQLLQSKLNALMDAPKPQFTPSIRHLLSRSNSSSALEENAPTLVVPQVKEMELKTESTEKDRQELLSLLTTLQERRQELEKLQEKFEFLKSLQGEEEAENEEKLEEEQGEEREEVVEKQDEDENNQDDLEVMLERLKLLEAKQEQMHQQQRPVPAASSAVQTELTKLDHLTAGVDKNAETLLRFYRDLQELQAMGADAGRIAPLMATLHEQMSQLDAHRSRLDSMKAVLVDMDAKPQTKEAEAPSVAPPVEDLGLGQEQLGLLDVVAVFLAKHDDQPAFTQRLFMLLNQLKTSLQKDRLVAFLQEIATEDVAATQEEDKIIELEEEEEEEEEPEAKEIPFSKASPFELSLAQFITGLETNERNLFTADHVTQVHAFVMAFVESNAGDLGSSWMQRFGDLLLQTMLVYIDSDLAQSKSKLLRDVNSLLYDVLVVSDEEEADSKAEDEPVKPFESSLQWKNVIEEDISKDVAGKNLAPLKKMDAVVDEIYRKLMIQQQDGSKAPDLVSTDDIILKLQDMLNQTSSVAQ